MPVRKTIRLDPGDDVLIEIRGLGAIYHIFTNTEDSLSVAVSLYDCINEKVLDQNTLDKE